MADAAFASQSRVATEPTRFERTPVRGTNPSLRPQTVAHTFASRFPETSETGQDNTAPQAIPAQFEPAGSGLLATGTGLLLAETRTAEAAAPFVAPTRIGNALNSYRETQAQIRESLQGRSGGNSSFVQISTPTLPGVDTQAVEEAS
ncbi:hypothetical protein KFE96_16725 [Kordiimonas sp. SCSIO 12603]|uniref:hypothetical protein n=1 Tax=Kordiimonas sp. SCSIO 12603 TaxID=2829596 RepID=UPI00210815AF|nr:hypothetical protein [Kordiimonas sp. SCSIO 12603]UTW58442.1 hypothetical protein KFE96_16725 [Kordiimonas sp. SCSIO 12603]